MKRFVLVLLALVLVFAVAAPAFAVNTGSGSPTDVTPIYGDDDDDSDDDDDHDNNNEDNTNTNDGDVTPPTEIVVASVSQDVERLMSLTKASDVILAVTATVPATIQGQTNSFTFQADALKSETGAEPATIPFTLYKIVGNEFTVLQYGVDYTINWETGEITILNVSQDCEFLFVRN